MAREAQPHDQLGYGFYSGLEPVLSRTLSQGSAACPWTSSCGLGKRLRSQPFPLSTRTSERFSTRSARHLFLCINPTTAPLTSSRGLQRLGGGFIPCLVWRPRPWKGTLRTLWLQDSFVLLPPLLMELIYTS
jgi:hypothetical protein